MGSIRLGKPNELMGMFDPGANMPFYFHMKKRGSRGSKGFKIFLGEIVMRELQSA
jgi:hypothetical protein